MSEAALPVLLPESSDWTTLGTGGGIQTFVRSLAEHASEVSLDLTVLCAGRRPGVLGTARMVPIMSHARSEFAFAARLRHELSHRRIELPKGAVVLANAEHYVWAFRNRGIPVVLMAHGALAETLQMRHTAAFMWAFRKFVEADAIRQARRILSISPGVETYYATHYPQSSSKVLSIPLGVDLAQFRNRPLESPFLRHSLDPGTPIVLFVGRLYPEKNLPLFLGACDQVATRGVSVQALVVGDGIERKVVRNALQSRPWLRWIPRMSHSELIDLMAVSAALVICSRYEGLPVVLLEAIASGLPVVSTEVGRARELLHSDNGRIVQPDSPAIASALKELLTWDRAAILEARRRLGEGMDFSWTARRIAEILREVSVEFCQEASMGPEVPARALRRPFV